MKPKHLPYEIDPQKNRNHYYETYWKIVGLNLLKKHFPEDSGASMLDFGCGRISATHGKSVQLDINDPLGQFGENSFDYVVCYHVLEHVPTPIETIGILSKIARKGVVIAVPNLHTLTRLFSRGSSVPSVNEGHLQSWDHGHLQNLAERHGDLELIEWGFDTTILPVFNRFGPALIGQRGMIWLETKVFPKLFPFHGLSVLGLFRPKP